MMSTERILLNLILCGLLGLIGQGIRVVIGLKKLKEEATAEAVENTATSAKSIYNSQFDGRQLWVSLLIGFIAGCLASFGHDDTADFSREARLAIVAAGYAGTDFIEGLFKKILPST
ncbi:hypothetical protein [Spirosoma aerophilum]